MGIFLTIILGLSAIIGIVAFLCNFDSYNNKTVKDRATTGLASFFASLIIVGIITGAITISCNLASGSDCQRLKVFYEQNSEVYRDAISETEDAVYIDIAKVMEHEMVSGENWQQSTNLSERIREFRDEIVKYNNELNSTRYWHKNAWTNWFVQEPDSNLKYLKLSTQP